MFAFVFACLTWSNWRKWDHRNKAWNNNAARATIVIWKCKLTREFNWWLNWLSMRFQYKLLSQHSTRYGRCLRSVNSICQTDLFTFVDDRDFSTDSRVPAGRNGRAIMRAPEGAKLNYTRYPDHTELSSLSEITYTYTDVGDQTKERAFIE